MGKICLNNLVNSFVDDTYCKKCNLMWEDNVPLTKAGRKMLNRDII